ncbi:MAG TPA: DNA repair protein RadA [Bacillota bacterium]|nr:DNA repair protein RadA [Bacillota bacterium]
MARPKTVFICNQCGFESPRWVGRCPGCEAWNTFAEAENLPVAALVTASHETPRPLDEPVGETPRFETGFSELDRVLGGGLVPGSVILLSGEPGVGKSTLLMQLAANFGQRHGGVLYVSGEESFHQLRLRATRLDTLIPQVQAVTETSIPAVIHQADHLSPGLLIVDSIQTMALPERPGFPGSVGQVRDCTASLLQWAKSTQTPCLIVGHITKTGGLAGPKVMEHMVDVVLYFEGDRHSNNRLLRAGKNRFGATNELALFQMGDRGLSEVTNPSAAFLAERHPGHSGTVVTVALEGSMPILVEIQALVAPAGYSSSRRLVTGLDAARVGMVVAVLERRAGLFLGDQDVYAAAIGGVNLDEPAVDLGVALAIASGFRDKALPQDMVVFGEVGLTGEIRRVNGGQQRLAEAARLGFHRALVPCSVQRDLNGQMEGIELIGVGSIGEAIVRAWHEQE